MESQTHRSRLWDVVVYRGFVDAEPRDAPLRQALLLSDDRPSLLALQSGFRRMGGDREGALESCRCAT